MSRRSVVVTGASTGIGAACTMDLASRGWRVFAGVRRSADGEDLVRRGRGRVEPLILDVTDLETVERAAEAVSRAVGSAGVQGLVNNAGVAVGGPVEFVALDDLRRTLEVNVVGVVSVTQHFLALIRAGRGRVVNMSSVGGRVAQPFLSPYCASKFALEAITDALRMELRPWGIRVALVEPGSIATPLWEKSIRDAQEARSRLPENAHRLYGRAMERMLTVARREGEHGAPPQRVAHAVSHALGARRPRTRYPVGADSRMSIAASTLLPDRAFDEVILRYTGLSSRT